MSTLIKFFGGFVLLGPNLILLPSAVAAVPEELGFGASEMWDAGLNDPSRSAMGFSHIAGALGTVASLFLMGRGAVKRVGSIGDVSAGVSEGLSAYAREVQRQSAAAPKAEPVVPVEPAAAPKPAVEPAPEPKPAPAPVPPPSIPPATVTLISRMTEIVSQQKALLDRAVRTFDVEALRKMGASEGQISQFFETASDGQSKYANAYGQMLEKLVKAAFDADPQVSAAVEHTGSKSTLFRELAGGKVKKGAPDWTGRPGGPLEGLFFDLTTWDQVAEHLARFYGENMVIFGYQAPLPTWMMLVQ